MMMLELVVVACLGKFASAHLIASPGRSTYKLRNSSDRAPRLPTFSMYPPSSSSYTRRSHAPDHTRNIDVPFLRPIQRKLPQLLSSTSSGSHRSRTGSRRTSRLAAQGRSCARSLPGKGRAGQEIGKLDFAPCKLKLAC
jgi:hypothetical protein